MKLSKDLKVIYLLSIICSLLLIVCWGGQITYDGPSYITAWNSFSQGNIDVLRTPIYPIYLGIIKTLFGESSFQIIVICIQHLIFLLSIRYFYKVALFVNPSKNAAFWLTLLYAVLLPISSLSNYILTESFAISGMVFLCYFLIRLFKSPTILLASICSFILLFLIFLRPSFIYIFPVLLLLLLIIILRYKLSKIIFYQILPLFVSITCILIYMKAFEKRYGVFALSSVSTINQYYMARQYGLLNIEEISNKSLRNDLLESFEKNGIRTEDADLLWDEANEMCDKYQLKEINEVIYQSYKTNKIGYIKSIVGRLYRSSQNCIFTYNPSFKFSAFTDILGLNLKINFLYLFLIIYTCILTFWIFAKKTLPLLSILFLLIGISNITVAIVGAQADWGRLILPSMPLYLLMFGQICGMFNVKSPLKIEFK